MSITEQIYDWQLEIAKNNDILTEITLSISEWAELYLENPELSEPPKKPLLPIKVQAYGGGFVGNHWNHVEYDYNAPEYLESLEKWKINCENWKKLDKNNIDFIGPYGIVKLTKE